MNSTAAASQTFKPIGVGADGATTYLNEVYVNETSIGGVMTSTSGGSITTQTGPETTSEFPHTPLPTGISSLLATLVADASHFVYSYIPPEPTNPAETIPFPAQVLNCTLDGQGNGSCVIKWWDQGGRFTETFTSSYSGKAVPLYTLTVGEATPTGLNSTALGTPSESLASLTTSTSASNVAGDGPKVTGGGSSGDPVSETDAPQENSAISNSYAWPRFGVVVIGILLGAGVAL